LYIVSTLFAIVSITKLIYGMDNIELVNFILTLLTIFLFFWGGGGQINFLFRSVPVLLKCPFELQREILFHAHL